jgi:protein SCO1/2
MQKIWALAFVVLTAISGYLGYQYLTSQSEFSSALVYPAPRNLSEFNLVDHRGNTVGREQLLGQWTLAFVGYTYCPDICPMTMATLSGAVAQLQQSLPKGQQLGIWFISVDPKRDTQKQMQTYVGYFEQRALTGVTASHDQLFPFVRELGLSYAISSSAEPEYRVDHSASIVLLNPLGQLVAVFKPEINSEAVPVVSKTQLLLDFPRVVAQLN